MITFWTSITSDRSAYIESSRQERIMNVSWFLIFAFLPSCGFLKKKEKTSKVDSSLMVTETVASGAYAFSSNELTNFADISDGFDYLSFNPSSLMLTLDKVILCKEAVVVTVADTGLASAVCSSGGATISMGGKAVDFAGKTAFTPVANFENDEVSEDQFGEYKGAVLYGGSTLTFSGSLQFDGETATYSGESIGSGGSSVGVNFKTPVTIDADNKPNISFLLDLAYPMYLRENSTTGTDRIVNPEFPNWLVLPYTGSGTPTRQTYRLVLDSETFGAKDKWILRVTVILDQSGEVYGAMWHPIFTAGYKQASGAQIFAPCNINSSGIVKTGSAYLFESTVDASYCPASGASTHSNARRHTKIAAFSLSDHTGTLTYAGSDYSYTATKE